MERIPTPEGKRSCAITQPGKARTRRTGLVTLAASLILFHPYYFAGAVLFRVTVPILPEIIRDFSNLFIFIGAARLDPLIPVGQAEDLVAIFPSGGADVAISWHEGGRELGEDGVQAARYWLARDRFRKGVAA